MPNSNLANVDQAQQALACRIPILSSHLIHRRHEQIPVGGRA
jgi:hypothetical protein